MVAHTSTHSLICVHVPPLFIQDLGAKFFDLLSLFLPKISDQTGNFYFRVRKINSQRTKL